MASKHRDPDSFGMAEFADLYRALTGNALPGALEAKLADGSTLRIEIGRARKPKAPSWAATLEVQDKWQTLDLEGLKAQHRALARKYHPDNAKSESERKRLTAKMSEINTAFSEAKEAI